MRNFQRVIFILTCSIVGLSSCTHKDEIETYVPLEVDTLCDPNTVYFVNDIQPILNSNCAYSQCHDNISQKDGVDLSAYDKIISTGEVKAGDPEGSELYEVIQEGEMPPSGPMASSQQQLIYDWIKQGAKNNKCIESCDTSVVTYSLTIKPTINAFCKGCHTGSLAGGGILITNYTELKAIATDGKLLGTIEYQVGFSPMPKNSPQLSDCNIRQINIWINEGMQNN